LSWIAWGTVKDDDNKILNEKFDDNDILPDKYKHDITEQKGLN
jgi:hypothetical protein